MQRFPVEPFAAHRDFAAILLGLKLAR